MKHRSILQRTVLTLSLLLLAGATNVRAADGNWTNVTDSIWSDATNWLGGVVADGAGSTATFSNELSAPVIVNLDSARTVGNLLFVQGAYSITNNGVDATNILTLEASAKPLVVVPPTITATIRRTVLAGTNGFILDGGGTLSFFKQTGNPTNRISGNVILTNNSSLIVQEGNTDFNVIDPALDSLGSITFYGDAPGGTLNLLSDASTGPSYGTPNNNLIVPAGQIATVILPPRFNGSVGDNAGAGQGMGGTLTGGGTLNLVTRYVRANVPGNWSAFTGQMNVSPGSAAVDNQWRFGSAAGFPGASVHISGTSLLEIRYYVQPAADGSTVIPIGALSSDNPNSFVTGSSDPGRTLTYRVGAKHTNATDTATFVGQFRNVAAGVDTRPRLAIIKEGVGTWILTGTNTHGGGTTINAGVLQIGDGFSESGSLGTGPVVINSNAGLVITRGGTLVVPGAVSGSGGLTNSGSASTVILAGANAFDGPVVVTAGNRFAFGTASTLTGVATIADGASLSAVVSGAGTTLFGGSVSFGAGCSYDFDLADFGNPTATVVTNTGAVSLNGNVTVNVAAAAVTLGPGTVTLLEYTSRTGTGSFVLGTLPNSVTATLNDDTANRRVTLTITAVVDPTLRWVGNAVGDWDVGNAANQVWRETSSGLLTNFYDSAFVRFDDTATGTTNINLTAPVSPAVVTVNNTTLDYKFGGTGWLTGTNRLIKQGIGKLTITTANDNTGLTRIDAGTVQIGDGGDVGQLGPGGIDNNGALVVNRTNALTVAGDISGAGSVTVIGDGTANSVVTFTPSSAAGSSYNGGTIVSNAAVVMGNATANGLDAAGTGLGTGPVTFYGNSGLYMFESDGGTPNGGGHDLGLQMDVPSGQNLEYRLRGRSTEMSTLTGAGTVNVRISGSRSYVIGNNWSQFAGQINFYAVGGAADLRLNSANDLPLARVHLANPGGSGNIARMMNQGAGLLPYRIGELSGDPGAEVNANNGDGGDVPASTVWIVGGLNTDSTFAGTTADPGNADHSFVKEGTGTWTLSGTNLHQGFTTVSNGVLALVGDTALSNSVTVTVASPGILDVTGRTNANGTLFLGTAANVQTLAGDGTVRGSVVLGANGRLTPGFSIGTLAATNGSITLGGTNVFELDASASPNSDRLSVFAPGTITYGGTLMLTNVGGAITGTNTFQLFSGAISGTFANVVTQDISGVTWDLSNLNVNGSIRLIGPVGPPPSPTISTVSIAGNTLTITGSGGAASGAYSVLSSTNVALPLAQWTVATNGSFAVTGDFSQAIAVDSNEPIRFYLIQTP